MHQALNTVLQLNEHTKGRYAGNNAVKFFADMVCHIFAHLEVNGCTLRIRRRTLTNRRMVSNNVQLIAQLFGICFLQCGLCHPGAQQAMHNQVRITADWRGKVRIILRRQAKVSDIIRLINSLLHGAQRYRSYQAFFRTAGDFLHGLLNILRLRFFLGNKLNIEVCQQLGELLHFFLAWNIMHAVDERPVLIKHVLRNCFVGRQHELLDNRLRITVDALHNLNRVQLFVQNNLLLRQIKVYSAATRTLVMQNLAQNIHAGNHRQNVLILVAHFLVACQNCTHNIVAQTVTYIDNRRENLVAEHLAHFVDMHLAGHGQTVLTGIQAADTVRQTLRQHRQYAVDKINACAALSCFLIQHAVFRNIIADIRNINAQQVFVIVNLLYINSIIQVLSILAVDGYDSAFTQITAACQLALFNRLRHLARSLQHLIREGQRQIILLDYRQNLQTHITDVAQNLGNLALGLTVLLRPFGNFYYYLLTILRTVKVLAHNIYILTDALVVRRYKGKITGLMENAYYLIISMRDDTQDFALRLFALRRIIHTRQHTVIVHRTMQSARRNEHVRSVALVIRNNKAKALARQLKTSGNQAHFLRQAVCFKACFNNLAVLLQRQQLIPKLVGINIMPQRIHQLLRGHRCIAFFTHKI